MLDELKNKAADLMNNPQVKDVVDKAKDFVADNKDKIEDFVKSGNAKELLDEAKSKLGDATGKLGGVTDKIGDLFGKK